MGGGLCCLCFERQPGAARSEKVGEIEKCTEGGYCADDTR